MKNKLIVLIALLLATIPSLVLAQFPAPVIKSQSINPASQIDVDLATVGNIIKMGDIQRAINILDRMLVTYGNDPRLRTYYKLAYKAGKLYPELERIIKVDLEQEPQNPYFLTELAEAKFLQNDEPSADSLWNQAIRFGRQDENSYRFVAENMMVYGLYESAINIYLKARQNLGNPAVFSMELANLYETQKDYNKAIGEYLTQVLLNPTQIGMVTNKIRGYLEDSDDSQRIMDAVTSRMKESPNRPELYEILGDLYIKQKQMDKALDCYKTISKNQNDDGSALIKFANRAYDSKSYSTAVNAVDEYFRISKKVAVRDGASLIKAKALLAAERTDEALSAFTQLSSTATDFHIKDEAGFSAGLIYSRYKNNCDSALIVWDAMQSNAKDIIFQSRAWLEMSMCDLKKDNLDSAENLLKQTAMSKVADSSLEKAVFFLGELSLYRENFKDANEVFKQLIKQYPQGDYSNDALLRLDVISSCGESDENNKYLSLIARAMKAQDLGRPLDAATMLSDSIFSASPIAEQALFYAAGAFAAGGNREKAISTYNGYIGKFPDGLYIDRAYLGLGDIYMQNPTTYGSAKAAFDKILEAFPEGPVTELARQRLLTLTTPGKIG